MLEVEIKSKRSTVMELQVRIFIKDNVKYCTTLNTFEYSFKEDLKKAKSPNNYPFNFLYRTENDGNDCRVYWVSPTKNERRLIAIIREKKHE